MDSDLEDKIVTNKIWNSQRCCLKPRDIPHLKFPDDSSTGPNRFYKMGRLLGYGGYGKVYAVRDHANDKRYALKVVEKEKSSKKDDKKTGSSKLHVAVREISILRVLKHPNIVELFELYESPKFVYLVLEQCNDSLHSFLIRRNCPLLEYEAAYVIQQVATALEYIHSNEIAHRDLKLENILCKYMNYNDKNDKPVLPSGFIHPVAIFGLIKLSDFGLGACRGCKDTTNMFTCCCGTPEYMAPEILNKKRYDQKCDIWSLGVVLFSCLIGMPPFPGKTQQDVKFQIEISKVTLKGKAWDQFSAEVKYLIKWMLTVNSQDRCSADQILFESWTNQNDNEKNTSNPES